MNTIMPNMCRCQAAFRRQQRRSSRRRAALRGAGGVLRELVGGKWAVEVEPEQPRDVIERPIVCVWGRERREEAG